MTTTTASFRPLKSEPELVLDCAYTMEVLSTQGNWFNLFQILLNKVKSGSIKRVGFDIGGCLVPSSNDRDDVTTLPPPFSGVTDVMEMLKSHGVEMYIVSFCGKRTAMISYEWLMHHQIAPQYIAEENVYFCDGDKVVDKAVIANFLQLDFFVDDRQEILNNMVAPVNRILKSKDCFVQGMPSRERWQKVAKIKTPSFPVWVIGEHNVYCLME